MQPTTLEQSHITAGQPSFTEINQNSFEKSKQQLDQSREYGTPGPDEEGFSNQQPHTYLQEKYEMEAAEELKKKPKYMATFKRGLKEGKGPSDAAKPSNFNQKLENCIDEGYF